MSLCSIRIRSRNRNIFEKPLQLNSNPYVSCDKLFSFQFTAQLFQQSFKNVHLKGSVNFQNLSTVTPSHVTIAIFNLKQIKMKHEKAPLSRKKLPPLGWNSPASKRAKANNGTTRKEYDDMVKSFSVPSKEKGKNFKCCYKIETT